MDVFAYDRALVLDEPVEVRYCASMQPMRLIPHGELHVFSQCKHRVQIDCSADFTRLVGNFLAD